jgi:uncharacterized protein
MAPVEVCAYCRRQPVNPALRPFCSDRCRLLDLAAWVNGTYHIAGDPLPDAEEGTPPDGENG